MYGIYGNMDPINIPPMLVYIYIYTSTMDPMGISMGFHNARIGTPTVPTASRNLQHTAGVLIFIMAWQFGASRV